MINHANRRELPYRAHGFRSSVLALAIVCSTTFGAAVFAAEPGANATTDQAQSADEQSDGDEFSQANHLLFMTDHLANIQPPTELIYTLARTGDGANSYDDHVDLIVEQGDGSAKNVKVDFLTGDRHRYVPDVPNAHGNPAVMMFLQNDVVEMAQRTGGNWRFFQRQIKLALQNAAKVEDTQTEYDGRTVAAKQIVIQPFSNARGHSDDIADEMSKRYVFTLSDQVPGGLVEIRSEIPGAGDTAPVERLQLSEVKTDVAQQSKDKPNA
ncbi:hypothetical protein [Salinisphaera sp. T31B1]|uniref:hypothetical protein n=1 Tax=Salinisphaera sp. T31B1 TaxID=727963 RepID=UPI0033413FD8